MKSQVEEDFFVETSARLQAKIRFRLLTKSKFPCFNETPTVGDLPSKKVPTNYTVRGVNDLIGKANSSSRKRQRKKKRKERKRKTKKNKRLNSLEH